MTTLSLPVGLSDYKEAAENGCYLIDKTPFIEEVVTSNSKVLFFTRPRRFGKTINLSMLRYFLTSDPDEINPDLFVGTQIAANKAFCRAHQNQSPVIYISFKGVKANTFAESYALIHGLISRLYNGFNQHLLGKLSEFDANAFQVVLDQSTQDINKQSALLKNSLADLCRYIAIATGKHPYLLIDEYDTPITAAYVNDYYEDMIDLMRGMLGEALKDNRYLNKGVLTGITRVSQESIFSGLNNLEVYSLLREQGGEYFGFTEAEVVQLLRDDGHSEQFAEIKRWYNGYQIGTYMLYNPWSIINCVRRNYNYQPYWLNTSDNVLIKEQLSVGKRNIKASFIDLLQDKSVERPLKENLVFPNLKVNEQTVWSLLHAAGYLNAIKATAVEYGEPVTLSIPNREVHHLYKEMIEDWFTDTLDIDMYQEFITSLTDGDMEKFWAILSAYLCESGSYFDFNTKTPEAIFHSLMLGLVLGLRDDYAISSNKESGLGRYDLLLIPKDCAKQGIVLEFKIADQAEQLKEKAAEALAQIEKKQYPRVFSQHKVKSALLLGLAFHGKQVEIASRIIVL